MASTTGWDGSSETGAVGNDQSLNNSSGFNAFPEGYRKFNGSFFSAGLGALFWSSAEDDANYAWYRSLSNSGSLLYRGNGNKHYGFSVRFVKDN
jgi:uncharacterized protein (TIGR02145 family)